MFFFKTIFFIINNLIEKIKILKEFQPFSKKILIIINIHLFVLMIFFVIINQ